MFPSRPTKPSRTAPPCTPAFCLARTQGNRVAFQIRNVNSHSLGVVATDGKTGRKRNAILIPAQHDAAGHRQAGVQNHRKPAQRSILVQIVEGESASPEDCSQLGKCVVRDLPPNLPADTPIEVQFRYADNGRLGDRRQSGRHRHAN